MIRYLTLRLFGAALLGSAASAGCATSVDTFGGEGGGGGEDTSSSSGTGGTMSACATDCSTIPAPPCQVSACNEETGQCEMKPSNGGPCDDGLFCTVGEVCNDGMCTDGSANPCSEIPADGCSGAVCDEEKKACTPQLLPDGTSCFIDDLCTVNAACKAGTCVGAPKDCFFAPATDDCNVSVCNPMNGKCEPIPGNDGQACTDDSDLCFVNKVCSGGACQGGDPKCAYLNGGCTNGICDVATGICSSQVVAAGEVCFEATDACNTGICQNNNTCVGMTANDGQACSDGNACTDGDVCSAGACSGMPSADYQVFFSETFADNAAGWTIGTEWAIGPAMLSPGTGTSGFYEDPEFDHTPTMDNGIAGVVIGGYASIGVHAMYYLESPPFDGTSMDQVHLQFWRILNSDYTSFMNNVIEIYNGATWSQIWESGSSSTSDEFWTFVTHDITQFKSANMRVRFGFDVGSSGAYTVGSWNIDDVLVANKVCP